MNDYIEIDLIQFLYEQAKTSTEKETCSLRAHALVQWLLDHYFPSKIRKSSPKVEVTSPCRGRLRISTEHPTPPLHLKEGKEISTFDQSKWEKQTYQTLKKIRVKDLGYRNATDLYSSIPKHDSEGRGIEDLQSLQKKLSVTVVFDFLQDDDGSTTDHVLLVGDEKKLEKKVFVLRNMLSHYHWRLCGRDVAFAQATSS